MKFKPLSHAAALILAAAGLVLAAGAGTAPDASADPKALGQDLAAQLRALQPVESSEITGSLSVKRGRGRPEKIPLVCRVTIRGDGWDSSYETSATSTRGAQTLLIKHFLNSPSAYYYAAAKAGEALPQLKLTPRDKLQEPLAGSDFWLDELGLEFLFWPGQTRLKGEMRLGQPCYVLESRDPSGRRVKSWIDKDSLEQNAPGLLVAESYDAKNELVKEFSLGGSSFKKIHGQWQLERMKIRSPKQGSETILKFDLPDGKIP